MTRPAAVLVALPACAALAAAGAARAEDPPPALPWHSPWALRLDPVEAGAEDLGPIGTSLRDMRLNLWAPTDFDRVYEVPGNPDLLMRAQGSLFAVFPRSVYALTGRGFVPQVPNDTIFYIGEDSLARARDPADPPPPGRPESDVGRALRHELRIADVDEAGAVVSPLVSRAELAVDLRAGATPDRPPAPRGGAAPPAHTIATDPLYRARRLGGLVRRAAAAAAAADQAARGRSSSSSSK